MTNREFREYLESIAKAARDAQRARDALELAEQREVGFAQSVMDGTRSRGSLRRDRLALRVHRYQMQRTLNGARLHDAILVLRAFRSELILSPLEVRACRALWCRHVCGMSYAAIGEELSLSHATCWRLVRDAESVLAESMGVQEPPKR